MDKPSDATNASGTVAPPNPTDVCLEFKQPDAMGERPRAFRSQPQHLLLPDLRETNRVCGGGTMSDGRAACETCKFFKAGICRRFSPATPPDSGSYFHTFPYVAKTGWCGEHVKREAANER